MTTDLYHRTVAFDYGDQERTDLMRKVWASTPWMVDAFTGPMSGERDRQMVEWCRDKFGDEAWPVHGRPGAWQRGGVTLYGWTWFGFDTEDKLDAFNARWAVAEPPHEAPSNPQE